MTTPFRISFEVPGNPVPKQRPQVGRHGAYYPERSPESKRLSYPEYKELVQKQCQKAVSARHAWMEVAKSFEDRVLWGLKVTAWVGSGDGDNIAGSVADALQGILWENDSQVRHWEVDIVKTKPREYRGLVAEAWVLEE